MNTMHDMLSAFLVTFVCGTALGANVIMDFETEVERNAAPRRFAKDCTICVTNAFATSGSHALYFQSGPWRKGLDEWPSFNLQTPLRDWRGFDRLAIDLINLGDEEDSIATFICAPDGRVQNGLSASSRLPARGYSQWIVPLNNWPSTCSPTNIGRVHLFLTRPRDVKVFIDRMTLLKEGETPPLPNSPCIGRDLLPFFSKATADAAGLREKAYAERAHPRAYSAFRDACLLAGQDTARMCVGIASSMVKVLPRGATLPAVPAAKAEIRLARNERESLQVIVAPGNGDLKGVRVRASDLKRADGAVFAAANVASDVTGYVQTKRKPPYKIGCWTPTNSVQKWVRETTSPDVGWWPDPILNFLDGVDVADMDAQSFWIRVRCPERQEAGVYSGTLTVTADGMPPFAIPFTVRVNAFSVPKASPLPLAITFSPGPSAQFATAEEQVMNARLRKDSSYPGNIWKKHEIEWGDFLADYYMTMDSLYHGGAIHWDVLLRLKQQGRLGRFNLGYWSYFTGDAEAEAKWCGSKVKQLKADYDKAKELGLLDSAYVYGCDEIATNWFGNIRRCVEILKKELPGVPISTTAYDHEFGVGTPLSVMDWFTPLTPKFDKEKAAASRAAGHQVWWYICCGPHAPQANMFIECPAIEGRILMGAETTRMRPDGFLYYQISIWNSPKCISSGPFTDWDPRSWTRYHGDGSWTCVGPDGRPLPTVRLENFRDGLEDYAYALELERKLKARGNADDDDWSRKARALLAVPESVMRSMTQFTGDPAEVLRWRNAMADLIESE